MLLFELMSKRRRVRVQNGQLVGWSSRDMSDSAQSADELLGTVPRVAAHGALGDPRRTMDHQSVSSNRGWRNIPDLELESHSLTRADVSFPHVDPVVGAIEYPSNGRRNGSLWRSLMSSYRIP